MTEKRRFCDYCECEDCINGWPEYAGVMYADTEDGGRICDVCFAYEVCIDAVGEPCDSKDCSHRPKLASDWYK